ncbi:MAG: hypothetical protein ACI9VR_001800 [Cognaticolwellia sp.]|jgi:hypothetical protein
MWILLSSLAWPCGVANHYRVLPLGVFGEAILALELSATRHEAAGTEFDLVWSSQPTLVRITESGTVPLQPFASVEWAPGDYERELSALLGRANKLLRVQAGFAPLSLEAHYDYGYVNSCMGTPLQASDLTLTDPSRWPTGLQDEDDAQGAPLGRPVGELRHYVAGEYSFHVVTVGSGSHVSEQPVRRIANGQDPASYSWLPSIPHHGKVFDMVLSTLPESMNKRQCLPD